MTENEKIMMIAEAEGLAVIPTHPYGPGATCAVSGFSDIQSALSVAARHGLGTRVFYRDDDERLWHRGCPTGRGISVSCDEFGRGYVQYDRTELRELRLRALSDIDSSAGDLELLGRAASFYGALIGEVLRLDEGGRQFAIGRPFDTRTVRAVTDYPMRFHSPAAGMEFTVGVA